MDNGGRSDFKDLIAWQCAITLAETVYALSRKFPRSEQFGLTAQIRRAAVSVPSNIAEGAARRTTREYIHFLHTARGSLAELETQLVLAERLGLASEAGLAESRDLVIRVAQLLNGLLRGLRKRLHSAET
jgi:four helix bundle protein